MGIWLSYRSADRFMPPLVLLPLVALSYDANIVSVTADSISSRGRGMEPGESRYISAASLYSIHIGC